MRALAAALAAALLAAAPAAATHEDAPLVPPPGTPPPNLSLGRCASTGDLLQSPYGAYVVYACESGAVVLIPLVLVPPERPERPTIPRGPKLEARRGDR